MATVYLSPTGSDSYTYAQAQNSATPWATQGKVQSSATTGDTVMMAAGTYTWATISFTKTFTWYGASLANGLPTTILDAGGGGVAWGGNHIFYNILFQNAKPSGANSGIFNAAVPIFTRCVFKNISFGGYSNTQLIRSYPYSTELVLTNCLIVDVPVVDASSQHIIGANGPVTFVGCTVVNSSAVSGEIVYAYSALTFTIKNCILSNAGGGLALKNGTVTFAASYSDIYNFASTPSGTGVITSDPQFIDEASGNFRLRPTSPCLNVGVAI